KPPQALGHQGVLQTQGGGRQRAVRRGRRLPRPPPQRLLRRRPQSRPPLRPVARLRLLLPRRQRPRPLRNPPLRLQLSKRRRPTATAWFGSTRTPASTISRGAATTAKPSRANT